MRRIALLSFRAGLSLIEVLVALTIVGFLIGLLLSAVQSAREASRRASCQNNLKQINLAMQQFQSRNRHFPAGMTKGNSRPSQDYMSWHVRVLPDLEQEAVYRETVAAFEAEPNFRVDPPHVHSRTVIPVFGCPSDARLSRPSVWGNSMTSYLGVQGTDQFHEDGMLFVNSAVVPERVRDGLSHTLLVGERPPSSDEKLGWWYAGWGQTKNGSAEMILGVRETLTYPFYQALCPSTGYFFRDSSLRHPCGAMHFWSLHPSGAHFAFGDGSVRFLTYSANSVLASLATRAGGETVSLPE